LNEIEFDVHTLLYAFASVLLGFQLVAFGGVLIAGGIGGSILAFSGWAKSSFGELDPVHILRIVMPAVFSLTLGVQIICSSFFLSILGLRRH